MEYNQSDYAIQARSPALQNVLVGLKKVFTTDPGLILQLLLIIPVFTGGIILRLNAIQWVLFLVVTLMFLVAGIFRGAALQQIKRDDSLTDFQASRIKCMGNALVTITAGISVFTYMMIFVPRITPLL